MLATLHQLFRRLDVDAFEAALSEWAQGELGGSDEAIAIDGKGLRGIHDELLPGVRRPVFAQGPGAGSDNAEPAPAAWCGTRSASTQLLADIREPLPAKPGRPRREDYEYERAGTRNLFCEPRRGWRHVAITRQRTMQDFAQQMRWLVDEAYPDVPVIRLVLDNLNTHRMASLYETFPAAEARRIAKRLEFHHTPKHGSWLNMAEIEFSVLARACLRGRNGVEDSLERAVSACVSERNAIGATINWRFTAQDARRKLHRLYPCQS